MKILLKKDDTRKIWFTSDTHYGHKNIVRGESTWDRDTIDDHTRPFELVEEMNQVIVDNINSLVGEDDILIHLGDFSFGGIDNIWKFRKQIKCKNIVLISGNHDHHIERNKSIPNLYRDWETPNGDFIYINNQEDIPKGNRYTQAYAKNFFDSVHKILNLTISREQGKNKKNIKHNFVLSHFPICSWEGLGKGFIHLHGHTHLKSDKKLQKGKMMDVGMEGNDLKPYSLEEIIEIMDKQPIKSLFEDEYHEEVTT